MRITKLGHSCLVIEEGEAKIIIDPGSYSKGQENVTGVHAVLITHEHPDHLHPDSLRAILKNNPGAVIYTNSGVGAQLQKESIPYTLLEDGQKTEVQGVAVEAFGKIHAEIYSTLPRCHNTGYLIAGKFYHGGDALCVPEHPIEILALPVVAPWMRTADAIDYAKAIKPKVCFPIHDASLKITGAFYRMPDLVLAPLGIQFMPLEEGREYTL